MFRFGLQKDHPSAAPTFDIARASVPIAFPTSWNRVLLKDAAVVIAAGNETGHLLLPPAMFTHPDCTPCKASDHQFVGVTQSECTGPATLTSSFATSDAGTRSTRSATRCFTGRDVSHIGRAAAGDGRSHGRTGVPNDTHRLHPLPQPTAWLNPPRGVTTNTPRIVLALACLNETSGGRGSTVPSVSSSP